MSNVTLFGFPRSTFVKVAGLILTARNVTYHFHDTEDEMYLPVHLTRHPFGRVPALQHGDFMLYETNAIAAYVDEIFPGPRLMPSTQRCRRASPSSTRVRGCTTIVRRLKPPNSQAGPPCELGFTSLHEKS